MKVDFNNLRKKAINEFDSLVKQLDSSIITDDDQYAKPNSVYHDSQVNIKNHVLIDADDIKEQIDYLRQLLLSVGMVYNDDVDGFDDVVEKEDLDIAIFNQEDEFC